MNDELIIVRQLPVIEDQLRNVKASVEARVNRALSLVCTEETYKEVKKERAELNKEYGELEKRRKAVKSEILAPYERFEALYKECAGDIYASADTKLRERIAEVENGLKEQRRSELESYFDEYRASIGIDESLVTFGSSDIKFPLSESKKAQKAKVKEFLDRIAGDLALIETQDRKEEILVEYRRSLNISKAVTTVDERHKAMEAERERRAALAEEKECRAAAEAEVKAVASENIPLEPPTATPATETETTPPSQARYSTSFKVTGTINELRALKTFLTEGGYTYEQL